MENLNMKQNVQKKGIKKMNEPKNEPLQTHGSDVAAVKVAIGTATTDIESLMALWTFASPYEAEKLKEIHLQLGKWYGQKQGQ
jgi:hypothetical protein